MPPTATLDLGPAGRAFLCHGAPGSNREYLWPDLPPATVRRLIEPEADGFTHLFVGHTHLQHERALGDIRIVNPGSTGQPRDGDSRAGYALFDTAEGRLSFHRLTYEVDATCAKIRERELPHAARLCEILKTGGG